MVYWCYVSVRSPWSVIVMPLLVPCGDSLLWHLEGLRSSPSRKSSCLRYFLRIRFCFFCGDLFVHRDLKSGNLLIATEKSIKIVDLRVARIQV